MKKIITTILLLSVFAVTNYAGTLIPLTEVPQPVNKVIEEYFPGFKALSAKQDMDHGKTKYEVKIQYKEIQLEVEVSPDGKILDVDMED